MFAKRIVCVVTTVLYMAATCVTIVVLEPETENSRIHALPLLWCRFAATDKVFIDDGTYATVNVTCDHARQLTVQFPSRQRRFAMVCSCVFHHDNNGVYCQVARTDRDAWRERVVGLTQRVFVDGEIGYTETNELSLSEKLLLTVTCAFMLCLCCVFVALLPGDDIKTPPADEEMIGLVVSTESVRL